MDENTITKGLTMPAKFGLLIGILAIATISAYAAIF
jgi:hypothetical protein